MSDKSTTVSQLRDLVAEFIAERDWEKYHDPKNLAMAIGIEVGELMEHFQWLRSDELHEVLDSPEQMAQVREEIADVGIYLLSLTNALGVDLASAIEAKMTKNRCKYPADRYRGRFRVDPTCDSGTSSSDSIAPQDAP
jgi:NTP pyrophosphatase (non-canonical NTP hydrolase)